MKNGWTHPLDSFGSCLWYHYQMETHHLCKWARYGGDPQRQTICSETGLVPTAPHSVNHVYSSGTGEYPTRGDRAPPDNESDKPQSVKSLGMKVPAQVLQESLTRTTCMPDTCVVPVCATPTFGAELVGVVDLAQEEGTEEGGASHQQKLAHEDSLSPYRSAAHPWR